MKKLLLKLCMAMVVIIGTLAALGTKKITIIENYVPVPGPEDEYEFIDQNEVVNAQNRELLEELIKSSSGEENALWKSAKAIGYNILSGVSSKLYSNPMTPKTVIINPKKGIKGKAPILLVSLHGTLADMGEAGKNMDTKASNYITNFAQWLADKHGYPVELLIFQWRGENLEEKRKEDGAALAVLIEKFIDKHATYQRKPLLCSITHSWGGAVMLYAAKKVREDRGIDFDLGIQMACPLPHVKNVTVNGFFCFKKLFQFYGILDATQVAGGLLTFTSFGGTRKTPFKVNNDHRVWGIRVQNDGRDINHVNIKWIAMEYMPQLITTIEKYYPMEFDLDANILSEKTITKYREKTGGSITITSPVLVTVRHEKHQLSDEGTSFNILNEQLFEKIYGRSIHEKSSRYTKLFKAVNEDYQQAMSSKGKKEALIEKTPKTTWEIEIFNSSKVTIIIEVLYDDGTKDEKKSLPAGKSLYITVTRDNVKSISYQQDILSLNPFAKNPVVYDSNDRKILLEAYNKGEYGKKTGTLGYSIDIQTSNSAKKGIVPLTKNFIHRGSKIL